ncbi:MAG: DUF1294 domain-containing protein [Clostridia bacterium]|nr:DUF1294 domain-containing protein [Clostridia bacterium]
MMKETILIIAVVVLAVMNTAAYLLMRTDKQYAKRSDRRIPERTLFLAAGMFGALGGTLGMFLLRHKTRHWYFRYGFPAMLAVQLVLLVLGALVLIRA